MRIRIVLALLTLGISSCAKQVPPPSLASVPLKPDTGPVATQCGPLIDGLAAQAAPASTVVIRNGRIESVHAGLAQPTGLPVLDLRDYTCLPGLIDMHTHVTETSEDENDMSVYLRRTPEEQRALSSKQAGETLRAGFTTIRNVGNYEAWKDRDLRDAINRGEVAGPRMQVVGFYLTIPNGGGDLIVPGKTFEEIPARFHAGVASTPAEFHQRAQEAIDGGADLLKVIASGAVLAYGGVPGAVEVPEESLREIVAVAH